MKLSWLFTLLCVLVLLALLPSTSSADDLAKLCIEPSEITVRPGERFTMRVMIYDVEDMGGFLADLFYVPSIVTAASVVLGDFIESNYDWILPSIEIDNENGIIYLGALSNLDEPPGPSGSGELAIITLVARGEGQTLLTLDKTFILGVSEGSPPILPAYTENARITVEPYRVYLPLVLR
jgi:hypothetical protein